MRSRTVVQLVVVAAVSLFILYAPSEASACPGVYEFNIEYWRMPVCGGSPPVCEQVEPELLGLAHEYCDWSVECLEGSCDGVGANRIVYRATRQCPLCEDQQP